MEETPAIARDPQTEEINLLDLAIVLAKHKKLIVGLPILAAVIALVVALLLPKIYAGTTRILPPQQKESSAAAMLGALTGAAGGMSGAVGQAIGIRNPNDLYIGILRSRTISDRLIERFKLKELYGAGTLVAARQALEKVSTISAGKDGLITIEVEDQDPQRLSNSINLCRALQ